MSEYKPTKEEELSAIKRYKKHQFKLKYIPFYREYHKRKTIKEITKRAKSL